MASPFRKNDFEASPAESVAYSAARAITAAASRMRLEDKTEADQFKMRRNSETALWQSAAWEYYDAIGEIKFAFNLIANIVSRIRLYAAVVVDPAEAPVDIRKAENIEEDLADAAERALGRLDSAYGGQAGLLRDAALNLSVAGEALDVDTLIPTPSGLKRMGDLIEGDEVYSGDGSVCRVIKAHPVRHNRLTYKVEFNTPGVEIIADEDHLWQVYQIKDRRWAKENGHEAEPVVLRTGDMAESVKHYGESNYVVKREAVPGGHSGELPIDPYILGYWLGDGWSSQGAITAHPEDQPNLHTHLAQAGYEFSVRNAGSGFQTGVRGLQAQLRSLGVLNNKHVPEVYLSASFSARLSLLQGLIDSDGHIKNGKVEFANKNQNILQSVVRLASSLGLRVGKVRIRQDGTSRVGFNTTGLPVARIPRKLAQVGQRTVRDGFDYIKKIEPVESRPVRCITVDSSDQTFLASERFIRTHNCYLVQVPARVGTGLDESWDIRSVDELQILNEGEYVIAPRRELLGRGNSNKSGLIVLPKNTFAGRIWRAHPRFSEEPDSSLRGLLDLCDELLLLNRTYRATHRSRLNAGILYIPDGLSNSSMPDPDLFSDEDDPEATPEELEDAFEESLIEGMSAPIEDEASANAVVPIILRGPADLGDKIKQFKFERAFDESMNKRYDRVLERILQGLDVPKDTVTGLANVKYSNAIQIDEALYKAHIEPMLLLIADAITVIYIRPYLKKNGWSEADVNRIVVWYDPSSVATRNDRAADADSGFEKMTISGDTWRRAHGFSDADAPTPNEIALRVLLEKGNISPELSEALLTVVAPEIMQAARTAQQGSSVAPVPGAVSDILGGGTGQGMDTADPNLATNPTGEVATPGGDTAPPAPITPSTSVEPVDSADAASPGEDGPPFPLAEPQ